MLTSSQQHPQAAWKLLLSHRQDFCINHLAQVPTTGAKVPTKCRCTRNGQKRVPSNIEFYWQNDQLDVDAVFRPAIATPFSPTAFDDLEM